LILSGACDQFTSPPAHRAQLLEALELVVREAQLRHEERASGQVSLFDMGDSADLPARPEPALPDVPRWTEAERLAREKEILGFFISGHPLEKYRDEVRVFEQVNTSSLKQYRDQKVEIACVVTSVSRQISKKNGSEWGRLTVEDFHGTASVLAFGDVWEQYHDLLSQDAPVLLRGSVSGRDRDEDAPPIFLDSVLPMSLLRSNGTLAVEVALPQGSAPEAVASAAEAFRAHPGQSPLYVRIAHASAGTGGANGGGGGGGGGTRGGNGGNGGNGGGSSGSSGEGGTVRLRSRSVTVTPSERLLDELRALFGADHIRLVRS
jgi:DNA polymerase III subunit alpha